MLPDAIERNQGVCFECVFLFCLIKVATDNAIVIASGPNGLQGWRYTPLFTGNLDLIYT